ncbi:hypothetical protein ACHAWF_018035 [Thalassiosira exigua]
MNHIQNGTLKIRHRQSFQGVAAPPGDRSLRPRRALSTTDLVRPRIPRRQILPALSVLLRRTARFRAEGTALRRDLDPMGDRIPDRRRPDGLPDEVRDGAPAGGRRRDQRQRVRGGGVCLRSGGRQLHEVAAVRPGDRGARRIARRVFGVSGGLSGGHFSRAHDSVGTETNVNAAKIMCGSLAVSRAEQEPTNVAAADDDSSSNENITSHNRSDMEAGMDLELGSFAVNDGGTRRLEPVNSKCR